ncbi:EAL domain-containing protein [Solirubrobacter sp. CPCC 204708]|nr:EAL domain-containing protein [Solirubrobacter deserti]
MTAILFQEAARTAELRSILEAGLVRSVYQPIVDLDTREVVGYEALARGPVGSPLERPDLLFEAARACGLVEELEWACRAAALRGALDARLRKTLFVNVEPSLLDVAMPEELMALFARATRELEVVIELTERALTDKPAEMLARVETMRSRGMMIALDDIGADPRSLALMPFVNPEVIKLDLRLVQENPSPAIAAIVHAVNAEAERPARSCSPRASRPRSSWRSRSRWAPATARGGSSAGRASCRPAPLPCPRRSPRAAPLCPPRRPPTAPSPPACGPAAAPRRCCWPSPATSRPRWRRRANPRWSSPPSRRRATSPRALPLATRSWPRRPLWSARWASV